LGDVLKNAGHLVGLICLIKDSVYICSSTYISFQSSVYKFQMFDDIVQSKKLYVLPSLHRKFLSVFCRQLRIIYITYGDKVFSDWLTYTGGYNLNQN